MRRYSLLLLLVLAAAACGSDGATTTIASSDSTTTTVSETTTTSAATTTNADTGFPVTVQAANGAVEIAAMPTAIVSLSPSATENLFAIGAGDQVVAVDDQSNYPEEAPVTDLSGFTPNLESILSYEPDLVVITFDPGDLIAGLNAVGVPTLLLPSATSVDGAYVEIETLGVATGHIGEGAEVVLAMQTEIDELVAEFGDKLDGVTIYHELDNTLYSVSSSSYVGELYSRLGLVNIADEADPDGFGYPQLSPEYIVSEDPDVILLADAAYGESIDTLRERPGWAEMTAVQSEAVIAVDPDLASRWTPRSVEYLREVAEAIALLVPVG
ncbi:MAG: ABC transporter substrate-binding protein [Acidimicrobiia bacterium]